MKKTLIAILIVILVLAVLTVAGLLAYQYFAGKTVDGPVMENPAAPMLELLSAEWMSEDGVWNARIEGETLNLSYQQDLVYSGSFSFDFNGDDLNVRTELQFYDKQFESEDGSVSGTMESLYVENCRMYLDISISKDGGDSVRQQAVLDRAEYGKSQPGELESEEIREVSEMAELVEFSWHQSAMSYDGCFQFRIKTTEQDHADPRLYCRYADPQTHEPVEIGDDSIGFHWNGMGTERAEGETWLPVPLERWEELADLLRKAELSAYRAPPPGLLDATSSIIAVTWQEDGEEFTNRYGGGTSAHDLLVLLQDIAREVSRKAEEPAAPAGWTCSCGQTGNTGRFCPECGKPLDDGDMQ